MGRGWRARKRDEAPDMLFGVSEVVILNGECPPIAGERWVTSSKFLARPSPPGSVSAGRAAGCHLSAGPGPGLTIRRAFLAYLSPHPLHSLQ